MQYQFNVAPQTSLVPPTPPGTDPATELLRQLLELQRDQLSQILKAQRDLLAQVRSQAQENNARWRNLLTRWNPDLPDFADQCQEAYPVLEGAYVRLIAAMARELSEQTEEALDSDFAIQEFLDRYGTRIGQIGHVLNLLGSLAEAAHQNSKQ